MQDKGNGCFFNCLDDFIPRVGIPTELLSTTGLVRILKCLKFILFTVKNFLYRE